MIHYDLKRTVRSPPAAELRGSAATAAARHAFLREATFNLIQTRSM